MSLKGWVNRMFTRVDLPPRPTPLAQAILGRARERGEPDLAMGGGERLTLPRPEHLGAYAPLVAAIREELERFVATHVRMHLAIAERDRYLLSSIEVDCSEDDEALELLRRFMREFKPEQVKHYLMKEVIGRLPNASAIDLAHFAGLNPAADGEQDGDDEAYGELLAELRRSDPRPARRPYPVILKGRWSEADPAAPGRARGQQVPHTPVAGQALEIEIDDVEGTHRVTLPAAVPGRRYAIGNGEGCDVIVNGKYVSRRHCEIWLDKGAWWVTDTGSTNGTRVESAHGVLGTSGAKAGNGAAGQTVIEVVSGARIVLSAVARGEPAEYPRLLLGTAGGARVPATPLAPAPASSPKTPVTPIAQRRHIGGLLLTAQMASGERSADLPYGSAPLSVGRSRSQALTIDWAHDDVSGHHLDLVDVDETGATVVVHGDNGVVVAGNAHPAGARFRWNLGEKMVLGTGVDRDRECALVLSRRP